MIFPLLLFGLVLSIAFFNGANDVSRGIATLVGSGVGRRRGAIVWGVLWTAAGGLTAVFMAQGLIKAFTGNGLVAAPPDGGAFLLAVSAGTLAWIGFATRVGLPVSTTHAIIGSLVGAGLASVGAAGLNWMALSQKFLLPLAFSPLLAVGLIFAITPLSATFFGWLRHYCVCLRRGAGLSFQRDATVAVTPEIPLVTGATAECECNPAVTRKLNLMDALHWLSAGATSFARGLNDTPKILALGLGAAAALRCSTNEALPLVTAAMAAGGLLAGFRVTETLARKVTAMSPPEGLAANITTTLLVLGATTLSLPVSTTHVSSGAIIGLGLGRKGHVVNWKTVRDMLLAWLVTLPATAGIAAAVFHLARACR